MAIYLTSYYKEEKLFFNPNFCIPYGINTSKKNTFSDLYSEAHIFEKRWLYLTFDADEGCKYHSSTQIYKTASYFYPFRENR
jgi:hypothetical protein